MFESNRQCQRTARRVGGACRQQAAVHRAPAQVYPSRPAWSSPYECYVDEGYGRFRPCNAGGDVQ